MDKSTSSVAGVLPGSSLSKRLRRRFFGERRNPFDPDIFRHISLIAFFAWVGMGADGVSSANYGPEEAFRAIASYRFLAPALAAAIAIVIAVIAASYSHIIEQFPTGGGGYVVASKLLHPKAGVVSGAALVIDYVLTISVSIVAGVDAIFSLLPPQWEAFRVEVAIFVVAMMIVMNLRGIRESVLALTPIFMLFIITHAGLVVFGLSVHLPDIPHRLAEAGQQAHLMYQSVGIAAIIGVFLHAFSMGAGTFTGIEAVSNGLLSLREPRVRTGKHTMVYMTVSLAFLAAMLLVNYFLTDVRPVEGKTLNAVLFERLLSNWRIGHFGVGGIVLWATLSAAAGLLFVAAQTGFIDGPRVLANMAMDSWLPHRLSHLSERLVTQNGIVLMGGAAIISILYAHGNTATLVNLYAINVFITFTLSQLGMARLWLQKRKQNEKWLHNFLVNGTGLIVCATMLVIMVSLKFTHGGWLTLVVTSALIALCFLIQRHYRTIEAKVREIDEILTTLNFGDAPVTAKPLDASEPTAVLLVEKYSGAGIHVLLNVQRLFGSRFKQFVFVSVGAIDSGHFKGTDELASLERAVKTQAEKYVMLARSYGLKAEARTSIAIEHLDEIERLCLDVSRDYPNSVFFVGRLLFWKDTFFARLLHNDTPFSIQRRLLFHGLQFVVLPIRLR
jgi:amino acid transporter